MYFVVAVELGDDAHAASYFKLEMGGKPIRHELAVVRILGLRIDRKLTWVPHIELLKYVFDTKRFPEAKVDKTFYEL